MKNVSLKEFWNLNQSTTSNPGKESKKWWEKTRIFPQNCTKNKMV